jgi:hypothetical protein
LSFPEFDLNILLPTITIILLISPGIVLSRLFFSKRSILFIVAVGFCLSLTIIGAYSIFLEIIQVNLNLETIAISFAVFDFVIILTIIYQNRKFKSKFNNKENERKGDNKSPQLFILISAIISLGFLFALPFIGSSTKENFTEIYLLRGYEGIAPWKKKHDKASSIEIDVNVTSHEKGSFSYLINLESDNQVLSSIPILNLESGKGFNVKLTIPPNNKPKQLYVINLTKCPTLDYCLDTNQALSFWIYRK